MIALYKYILEVNAKEEEELFQLKDNADTKANGHHKPGTQKPRWEVRSMSGIASGRLRAGGSGSSGRVHGCHCLCKQTGHSSHGLARSSRRHLPKPVPCCAGQEAQQIQSSARTLRAAQP